MWESGPWILFNIILFNSIQSMLNSDGVRVTVYLLPIKNYCCCMIRLNQRLSNTSHGGRAVLYKYGTHVIPVLEMHIKHLLIILSNIINAASYILVIDSCSLYERAAVTLL